MSQDKLIAKTNEWRAYLINGIVEIEKAGVSHRIVLSVEDLQEFSRLVSKANGYFNLKSKVLLPSDLLFDGEHNN